MRKARKEKRRWGKKRGDKKVKREGDKEGKKEIMKRSGGRENDETAQSEETAINLSLRRFWKSNN